MPDKPRTARRRRQPAPPTEPHRLDPREAKRLALLLGVHLLRLHLDADDVADLLRQALIADGQDPDAVALDTEQAARVLAVKLDEVVGEVERRAAGYTTPRSRQPKDAGEVDDLLLKMADLGVEKVVTTSEPKRHRHGHHAVQWEHPDGTPDTAEGSTARTAVRRAQEATQARLRKKRRGGGKGK